MLIKFLTVLFLSLALIFPTFNEAQAKTHKSRAAKHKKSSKKHAKKSAKKKLAHKASKKSLKKNAKAKKKAESPVVATPVATVQPGQPTLPQDPMATPAPAPAP